MSESQLSERNSLVEAPRSDSFIPSRQSSRAVSEAESDAASLADSVHDAPFSELPEKRKGETRQQFIRRATSGSDPDAGDDSGKRGCLFLIRVDRG